MHSRLTSPQVDLMDAGGALRSFRSRAAKIDDPLPPDVELVLRGLDEVLRQIAQLCTACTIVLGRYAEPPSEDAA